MVVAGSAVLGSVDSASEARTLIDILCATTTDFPEATALDDGDAEGRCCNAQLPRSWMLRRVGFWQMIRSLWDQMIEFWRVCLWRLMPHARRCGRRGGVVGVWCLRRGRWCGRGLIWARGYSVGTSRWF